jgi:simple sugar transport system permease protein
MQGDKKSNFNFIKKLWLLKNKIIIYFILFFILFFILLKQNLFFYFVQEIIFRFSRNLILVLSLLTPIMSGLGINFGIIVGAMIAQVSIVLITNWQIENIYGILITFLISTPLSIIVGYIIGIILNKSNNREMIISMMIGFFLSACYQLFLMYFFGDKTKFFYIININNKDMLLSRGYGLRNTIELKIASALDNIFCLKLFINNRIIKVPIFTLIIIFFICLLFLFFENTKLAHHMRAVGYNKSASKNIGINIKKIKIISLIISTLLSCYGQIIYIQNIGILNTYNAAEQAATFAIASLLIGGVNKKKARIKNIILGTILFHSLLIIMPILIKNFINISIYDEYIRSFIYYSIILISLIIYSLDNKKSKKI